MWLNGQRSLEGCRAELELEAERAWGDERMQALEPLLRRTAEALWRTTRRAARSETVPSFAAPAAE